MENFDLRKYLSENKLLKEEIISKYLETVEEDGDVYEDFKIDVVKDYVVSKRGEEDAEEFLGSDSWEDARYSFFDVDEESTDADVEEFLDTEMGFYFGEQLDDSGNVDYEISYEDVNGDIQVVTINAPSDEEAVRKASEIEGFVIAKSLESI
jgi:hypothetical protein